MLANSPLGVGMLILIYREYYNAKTATVDLLLEDGSLAHHFVCRPNWGDTWEAILKKQG